MPKTKATQRQKANAFRDKYPNEIQVTPADDLFCKLCEKTVVCEKSIHVEAHRKTAVHTRGLSRLPSGPPANQTFLPTRPDSCKQLVIESMVDMDIPLNKLRHKSMKKLADFCGKELPSVTAGRKMVSEIAETKKKKLAEKLRGESIFVIADESEYKSIKFVNVMCGSLSNPEKSYLLSCKATKTSVTDVVTVLTRWASWLEAALFYAEQYSEVKDIVLSFEDDGLIVSKAKSAISDADLQTELILVCEYRPLVELVLKMESQDFQISQAYSTISRFQENLKSLDPAGFLEYLTAHLQNNPDLCEIIEGNVNLSPAEYSKLRKAQPSSGDVERSFPSLIICWLTTETFWRTILSSTLFVTQLK